jgi:hypothetical protein
LAWIALLLCAASPPPAPDAPPAPATPAARDAAVAEQFAMLAFDADPATGGVPRTALARWHDPVALLVAGSGADAALAASLAATLTHLTGVPIRPAGAGAPNLLVAVTPDPVGTFTGPLGRLLLSAFGGDRDAADVFVTHTVAVAPCWVVAVWGDAGHTAIKAAVVGIDARQDRPAIARCMAQKLAGAMGLLGQSGYLPRSVFTPGSGAIAYSREDALALRLLYSPVLQPGMTREEAHDAALAALPALHHAAAPAPRANDMRRPPG